MSFRFIIVFIILLAIDIYAFQSFRGLIRSNYPDLRKFIYISYWAISAIAYIAGISMLLNLINENNQFLTVYGRTLIMILVVGKLLSLPLLLIDDIRRGILSVVNHFFVEESFDLSRSRFLSGAAVLLGATPIALLTYGMFRNPYRYKVRRKNIHIEGLHGDLEGYKIVQISDVHSGSFVFKEPILNGIDLINQESADLVVFTGDIVNYRANEMDHLIDVFNQIKSGTGIQVHSILGNHDYGDYFKWKSKAERDDNFQNVLKIHENLGWKLMLNEHVTIKKGDATIGLMGIENFSALPQFPKYGNLAKAAEGMPESDFKILLSHDPSHWDYEVNKSYEDINLMLSGHTHGFQFGIEIPGFITWSPSQYVYKQWAGLYKKGRQYLYVNRGFGFLGYAGRVGILPEITVLTLTGNKDSESELES